MILQQSASIQLNKVTPPGPPNLPLVGSLPFLQKNLHLELHKLANKYGNIYQLHVGGRNVIVINGLDAIKEALVKQQDSFNARADYDLFKQPPVSSFLEFKSGEFWKKHRGIVSQVLHTFVNGKLDTLEEWVLEAAADLANIFLNFGGQSFDPELYLPRATLSFMQRLMFDQRSSLKESEDNTDFVNIARVVTKLNKASVYLTNLAVVPAILRPILILPRLNLLQNAAKASVTIQDYVAKNVEQHRDSLDPENLRDITDGLLKASSEQTESDRKNFQLGENDIVKGTLCQFTSAGLEIPGIVLYWALLYMIAYPEIQAEIHKELDEVVGRKQQIRLNDRGKLAFTEACINEILRHAAPTNLSPVPYGTVSDTTLEGYFIPEKSPVFVNYYSLTRDEHYWEEPEQFNPYRFLDANGKLRKDRLDKFYPFGMGARRCIGEYFGRLQIFLFFTNLMHQCKFEKLAGDKLSLEPQPGIFMNPKSYRVTVKPRF